MTADLWTFATTVYARPGVETACLELQDTGADVCLLLCGLWLDHRGVAHDEARERQLRQLATPWQCEVVMPLRALRQQWRHAAQQDSALNALRQQLKQLELDAEREQLQHLQALTQGWPKTIQEHAPQWLQALAPENHASACERLRHACSES